MTESREQEAMFRIRRSITMMNEGLQFLYLKRNINNILNSNNDEMTIIDKKVLMGLFSKNFNHILERGDISDEGSREFLS